MQNEWQGLKPNCVDNKGKFSHCRLFYHQSFLIRFCSFNHLCLHLPLPSFTHGTIHAFIRACIHSPLQLVFHSHLSMYIFPNSMVHSSLMRSSIDSLIASHFFVQSNIHSLIRLFIHSFFHSRSFRHFMIHPFIHSQFHAIIHLFCHSLAHLLTDSLIFVYLPCLFVCFVIFITFFHPFIISFIDRFLFSIICFGAGAAMVRLRIVFSGGAGSMQHPYTFLLAYIRFYLCPPHKFIHERVCTSVRSAFNHHQIHSKVPHSPPLAHATCRPATRSFRHWPTHSIQWLVHSPIHALSALIYSPGRLLTQLDILKVAEFWPHRTSRHMTRISRHVSPAKVTWNVTCQWHHPQTFAITVPRHWSSFHSNFMSNTHHTHNSRIPSNITHISRHTSFTSPTSHITCHFQRLDFNS